MIDYRLFGVKPSNIISGYCYSVFRLEPYSTCTYNCIYCYARWYRAPPSIPSEKILRYWERIASKLAETPAPKPYFRLATLVEPFQEKLEINHKYSYRMLETAYNYRIPIVINTKSTLIAKDPWLKLVNEMASEKLVLVQISLSLYNGEASKILEPNAPPPEKRIELIDLLKDHDIPVVLRLQPLIPGLEEEHLTLLENIVDRVDGVIIESIRLTSEELEFISSLLEGKLSVKLRNIEWVKYTVEAENLYTPSRKWKREVYDMLREIVAKRNIPLTTCKDYPLILTRDCCLFWVTGNREYGVRETIREKIYRVDKPGVKIIEEYDPYPNPVRKILRLHNNKLLKIISNPELLNWIKPLTNT